MGWISPGRSATETASLFLLSAEQAFDEVLRRFLDRPHRFLRRLLRSFAAAATSEQVRNRPDQRPGVPSNHVAGHRIYPVDRILGRPFDRNGNWQHRESVHGFHKLI